MTTPATTPEQPYRFSVAHLIDRITQRQPDQARQEMWDWMWEVNVLALTLDGEGRGESMLGRAAIAWSVKNRQLGLGPLVDKDKSIVEVCLRKSQYSTWFTWGGLPNYVRLMRLAEAVAEGTDGGFLGAEWKRFDESRYIAQGVLQGKLLDPTGGAAHYMTKARYYSPRAPRWISAATGAKEIGSHIFLRGIR